MKTAAGWFLVLASFAAPAQRAVVERHPERGVVEGRSDQSDIRVVSSFVAKGHPVPAECEEEAHTFAHNVVRYPRPVSWHWILICDEAGWQNFLRGAELSWNRSIYASTDLISRSTYLRGDKMLYPYDLGAEPERVIAHELAHIYLNSEDEAAVQRLSRLWLRSWRRREAETARQVVVHIWESSPSPK